MRIVRNLAVCSIVILPMFTSTPALAQFSYDRIEDDFIYGFEKPVEFTGNSRYNRVEGLYMSLGLKVRPPGIQKLQLYGDLGYGFWNEKDERVTFSVGARKDFFDFKRLSFGAEVFKQVTSNDDWALSDYENSLAAVLFGKDAKDYYGAFGGRFYVDHRFIDNHVIRLELAQRSYEPLEQNIDWSLFDKNDDDFAPNPRRVDTFIADGSEFSAKLILALDWRDNPIYPLTGWYVQGIFEHTEEDFDTDGFFLTVKRFQQTFGNHRLLLRGMLGTIGGTPTQTGRFALQSIMNLGGAGRLRGLEDYELIGNRAVMFNANYLFNGDVLQRVPLQGIPIFGSFWTTLSLGVFFDAGWATFADPEDSFIGGFDTFALDDFKADVGLSILVLEGVFRVDIAKRTDRSEDDFRVTFRLLEHF